MCFCIFGLKYSEIYFMTSVETFSWSSSLLQPAHGRDRLQKLKLEIINLHVSVIKTDKGPEKKQLLLITSLLCKL